MHIKYTKKQRFGFYLMLSPYLVGLFFLVVAPALLSLWLAFTRYDALREPVWTGFTNLINLGGDRLFWIALGNTMIYVFLAVLLRLIGALGLAVFLHRRQDRQDRQAGLALARTTVYLPTVIPDVAYALIWLVAFNPRFGPVNLILGGLGLPTPDWLVEPWPARLALVMIATWQLGEGFVVFLASLSDIPTVLYETAAMDGAGVWTQFWHITFPLLLPRLLLLTARDFILCLQANFVPSLVMTKGGPGYATLFLPLYSYFLAFEDLRFGYAAAVLWSMYLITVLVVIGQYWLSRRWQYQEAF